MLPYRQAAAVLLSDTGGPRATAGGDVPQSLSSYLCSGRTAAARRHLDCHPIRISTTRLSQEQIAAAEPKHRSRVLLENLVFLEEGR